MVGPEAGADRAGGMEGEQACKTACAAPTVLHSGSPHSFCICGILLRRVRPTLLGARCLKKPSFWGGPNRTRPGADEGRPSPLSECLPLIADFGRIGSAAAGVAGAGDGVAGGVLRTGVTGDLEGVTPLALAGAGDFADTAAAAALAGVSALVVEAALAFVVGAALAGVSGFVAGAVLTWAALAGVASFAAGAALVGVSAGTAFAGLVFVGMDFTGSSTGTGEGLAGVALPFLSWSALPFAGVALTDGSGATVEARAGEGVDCPLAGAALASAATGADTFAGAADLAMAFAWEGVSAGGCCAASAFPGLAFFAGTASTTGMGAVSGSGSGSSGFALRFLLFLLVAAAEASSACAAGSLSVSVRVRFASGASAGSSGRPLRMRRCKEYRRGRAASLVAGSLP
eukprot:m.42023 g.42023  ORF g.42023 m.42023 type:complete len:401 (-) comp5698_c1_seq1:761-1963(-)